MGGNPKRQGPPSDPMRHGRNRGPLAAERAKGRAEETWRSSLDPLGAGDAEGDPMRHGEDPWTPCGRKAKERDPRKRG